MANAAKLLNYAPVRALAVGYPKAGKTGMLAVLANAGFKLRILDFDGNLEPLLLHLKPEAYSRVDAIYFEDKLRKGAQFIEPVGIPTAFTNALNAMDEWKYTEEDGTEVNLGASKDWGPDTIVVLDSLTKMGDAAFRRAYKMLGKNPSNITQQVWMLAMNEQAAFIEKLTSNINKFHVIVLAHLKMISPKDIQKGDEDLTKELKQRVADLVPTRYFPRALGQELPQVIGGEFPTLIQVKAKYRGNKAIRVIETVANESIDLGVPAPDLPAELPLETGMLTIFKALSPGSVDLVMGKSSPHLSQATQVATGETK